MNQRVQMRNWFLVALAGYGFVRLLRDQAIEAGTVISENIEVLSWKWSDFSLNTNPLGFRFNIRLRIRNNNDIGIPFNSFAGQLLIGDLALGNLFYDRSNLPANEETELLTSVLIDKDTLGDSFEAIKNNPLELFRGMLVKGDMFINSIRIPVETPLI